MLEYNVLTFMPYHNALRNFERLERELRWPECPNFVLDISRLKLNKGGGYCICDFFGLFFLKNRFLSDYVVPACPKYISGKLRHFSKKFSKNFFHTALFENFLLNGVSVAAAKNQPAQGLGTPQNRPWPKKSIFSKSEISIPQSNHGKRNIKLMLVRP